MSLPTAGEFIGTEPIGEHKISYWQFTDVSGTILVGSGYCCLNCEEFWKNKEQVTEKCANSLQ